MRTVCRASGLVLVGKAEVIGYFMFARYPSRIDAKYGNHFPLPIVTQ
jgi:hypothetical protein